MPTAVETLLLEAINSFFSNKEVFMRMYNIINRYDEEISLRVLEFMFTKFSKRYDIVAVTENFPIRLCDIYNQGLKMYGKAHFDCFKRHQRCVFKKHGLELESTIGQMTFFRHIIPTGALDFAKMYLVQIKEEMSSYSKQGGGGIDVPAPRGSIERCNLCIKI